jgi:hypothetical protein
MPGGRASARPLLNKEASMAKGMPRTEAKKPAKVAFTAITPLTGAFGTTGDAIVDVTGAFVQATLNNNFRRLEDKINALIAASKL